MRFLIEALKITLKYFVLSILFVFYVHGYIKQIRSFFSGPFTLEDINETVEDLNDSEDSEDSEEDTDQLALRFPLHSAARIGDLDIVKFLIASGANIEVKEEKHDWTPLHFAVANGHLEVIKHLIENGANVNAKASNDNFPLEIAAYLGHLEILKYLLGNGANINDKDNDGWTPLHFAAYMGHLEIVKYLVEKGSTIEAKTKMQNLALQFAEENGHLDVVEYLSEIQRKEDDKEILEETWTNKALCIICLAPRNGIFALFPCGHASMCRFCCMKIQTNCPTCRTPVHDFKQIFLQVPE